MFKKADTSALWAVILSLVLFFVGGILTTIVPPMVDHTWAKPFENNDPAKGPTGKLVPLSELELKGRAIYQREGCWYCHTQQIRTLLADTKRYGWKGVDAPISTPDEFVYDNPHMFGTKRTGPDLARVGGKYDTQWHRTHFRNPRDLVKGSIMPTYPWIVNDPKEFEALVAYMQTLGRAKDWRPNHDYEK
ncbi:MAG: cbb3-type cytochrome c oxidase subunit II [Firmicutes bacterium]|nr:cbb3-type cytochrome c oxidase subunit II [Bacillota bacterium]